MMAKARIASLEGDMPMLTPKFNKIVEKLPTDSRIENAGEKESELQTTDLFDFTVIERVEVDDGSREAPMCELS